MFLTNIEIKNQRVLDLLNYSLDLHQNKYKVEECNNMIGELGRNPEDYVGEAYLEKIKGLGRHTF